MFLDDYADNYQMEDNENSSTAVAPEEQETPVKARRSILVVDDDKTQTEILSFRFGKLGYQVKTAHSGEEALEIIEEHRPDLILLDIQMPGIDGLSLCRRLSDEVETCEIPIILLSGIERRDIVRQSRSSGCRYFVSKPYDPNALLILAESALSESGDW